MFQIMVSEKYNPRYNSKVIDYIYNLNIPYLLFRLAWFDAVEMLGSFVGTCLSPYVFNAGGYYAIYVARLFLVAAALIYWYKFIKTPAELEVMRAARADPDNVNTEAVLANLEKKKEAEKDDRVDYK